MDTSMLNTEHPTFKCFERHLNSGELKMMTFGDFHYGIKVAYDMLTLNEIEHKNRIRIPAGYPPNRIGFI